MTFKTGSFVQASFATDLFIQTETKLSVNQIK